jgi:hypothetical protein
MFVYLLIKNDIFVIFDILKFALAKKTLKC